MRTHSATPAPRAGGKYFLGAVLAVGCLVTGVSWFLLNDPQTSHQRTEESVPTSAPAEFVDEDPRPELDARDTPQYGDEATDAFADLLRTGSESDLLAF